MTPRVFVGVLLAAISLAGCGLLAAGLWIVRRAEAEMGALPDELVLMLGGGGLLAFFLLFVLAYAAAEFRLLRPMALLARQTNAAANSRADRVVEVPKHHSLGELPDTVDSLSRALVTSRNEVKKAMATATGRLDEVKDRLEAILIDLTEGVLVCNLDHRIMLYNQSAVRLLKAPEQLGLGRSLFGLITREPVVHTLEQLEYRLHQGTEPSPTETSTSFVCSTEDMRGLLQGRMSLVLDKAGAVNGYVLTFVDISADVVDLAHRDSLLRQATEGLRSPVANLRAAAETLATFPALAGSERTAFEQVIFKESKGLSERLDSLASAYRRLIDRQWPFSDIFSADLIGCVARHLKERDRTDVVMVGIPLWLHGDSHFLMLTLEYVIRRLHAYTGASTFDVEPLMGDRNTYIEIAWKGEPVPAPVLDGWLDQPLEGAIGDRTARQVLDHHGSEVWSQARPSGQAALRMPLPAPSRPQFDLPREQLPARPEFYDFDLMHQREAVGERGRRMLRELSYVVFDTETTGLRPSGGDEIIALAGVRIVNSRILAGETFVRLVNPHRPIPPASIRFHQITDAMVRDKPPIQTVLPQFKTFVGDAVLVAHNAAFDMKFIRTKETESGIVFDNPVLDSLLLSVLLEEQETDHTLDGIAARFGVEVTRRHTALGDAMVTAGVFLHFLDMLEAQGIHTLDQAFEATESLLEIRKEQEQF